MKLDYTKLHIGPQQKYDQLMAFALKRPTLDGYTHQHHIKPRCLFPKGTPKHIVDKDNLVTLTLEEHVVAHVLLCFIYPENKKLGYAIYRTLGSSSDPYCRLNISDVTPEFIQLTAIAMKTAYDRHCAYKRSNKSRKSNRAQRQRYMEERPKEWKALLKKLQDSHTTESFRKLSETKKRQFANEEFRLKSKSAVQQAVGKYVELVLDNGQVFLYLSFKELTDGILKAHRQSVRALITKTRNTPVACYGEKYQERCVVHCRFLEKDEYERLQAWREKNPKTFNSHYQNLAEKAIRLLHERKCAIPDGKICYLMVLNDRRLMIGTSFSDFGKQLNRDSSAFQNKYLNKQTSVPYIDSTQNYWVEHIYKITTNEYKKLLQLREDVPHAFFS